MDKLISYGSEIFHRLVKACESTRICSSWFADGVKGKFSVPFDPNHDYEVVIKPVKKEVKTQ